MPARVELFGVQIDRLRMEEAVAQIQAWVADSAGRCHFVVTPNVDHVVMLEHHVGLQASYRDAGMVLVDGAPVLWASRLLRTPLPAKVSGSDLVKPLMQRAAERGHRVYFLGGDEGVAEKARDILLAEFPTLNIVGIDSPRIQVDTVSPEIIQRVRAAQPHLVLVALGAPKQEIFSHEQRAAMKPAVLVGVGASLDFIANVRKRAPAWLSKVGLEWLFRLAQEPRRLAARYFLRDPQFFWIVARQLSK